MVTSNSFLTLQECNVAKVSHSLLKIALLIFQVWKFLRFVHMLVKTWKLFAVEEHSMHHVKSRFSLILVSLSKCLKFFSILYSPLIVSLFSW